MSIRKTEESDLYAIKEVLNTIELFPANMLEGMINQYLEDPKSNEIWFTKLDNDKPIGFIYCSPEQLTEGTFNLYAIGVRKDIQGRGIGRQMMAHLENELRNNGHRVLIVETSSSDEYLLTRKFYENLNYSKEAVIRDFWSEGDDKVIYWKKLQ